MDDLTLTERMVIALEKAIVEKLVKHQYSTPANYAEVQKCIQIVEQVCQVTLKNLGGGFEVAEEAVEGNCFEKYCPHSSGLHTRAECTIPEMWVEN
jgi:hypothetical protein